MGRNERGGQSSCVVPAAGDDEWIALTEDWTAAAEVHGELRMQLEGLLALGYTGSGSE